MDPPRAPQPAKLLLALLGRGYLLIESDKMNTSVRHNTGIMIFDQTTRLTAFPKGELDPVASLVEKVGDCMAAPVVCRQWIELEIG